MQLRISCQMLHKQHKSACGPESSVLNRNYCDREHLHQSPNAEMRSILLVCHATVSNFQHIRVCHMCQRNYEKSYKKNYILSYWPYLHSIHKIRITPTIPSTRPSIGSPLVIQISNCSHAN